MKTDRLTIDPTDWSHANHWNTLSLNSPICKNGTISILQDFCKGWSYYLQSSGNIIATKNNKHTCSHISNNQSSSANNDKMTSYLCLSLKWLGSLFQMAWSLGVSSAPLKYLKFFSHFPNCYLPCIHKTIWVRLFPGDILCQVVCSMLSCPFSF